MFLFQVKQIVTVAQKPFGASQTSLYGPKDDKFEDVKQPPNCVETLKPSPDVKKIEKECQPLKDVEVPRPQNHPKKNEQIDEGLQHRKFDDHYNKASGVPFWVNTRIDYEVCIA